MEHQAPTFETTSAAPPQVTACPLQLAEELQIMIFLYAYTDKEISNPCFGSHE
jgi:hypothetical protein